MSEVLIIYATTDGQTKKICSRIKQIIESIGNNVTLTSIKDNNEDLTQFDKIIIGASIRYGKHSKDVYSFFNQNQSLLENKVNAFFSVNVVARKSDKNTVDTNPYMQKFLTQINFKPQLLEVFAGKIDYPKYKFIDKNMIRMIMWMTKGPTDLQSTTEFTDWDKVLEFSQKIIKL